MRTFDHHAAILLFDKAKTLGPRANNSWRCIYIKMSDLDARRNHNLREQFIVPTINRLLADHEGYIYLCDDGDIFILFQGALRPIMNKLAEHFKDLKADCIAQVTAGNVFTVFDLSRYGQEFFNLCKAKYLQAMTALEELPEPFSFYDRLLMHSAQGVQE